MLIRFTSNKAGEMIMLAEHARQLFEIIGKACTARGVILSEQIPEAIERLHQAIAEERQQLLEAQRLSGQLDPEELLDEDPEARAEREEECKAGRRGMHLCQRAQPLINLMQWTLRENGFILWEAPYDF